MEVVKVFAFGLSNDFFFFKFNTKSKGNKCKNQQNKWDCSKLQSFCSVKETIKKLKVQPHIQ